MRCSKLRCRHSVYKGDWDPPLPYDPVPWSDWGGRHGFDFVATIVDNPDWDPYYLDPDGDLFLR